jgi:hypothetical protein
MAPSPSTQETDNSLQTPLCVQGTERGCSSRCKLRVYACSPCPRQPYAAAGLHLAAQSHCSNAVWDQPPLHALLTHPPLLPHSNAHNSTRTDHVITCRRHLRPQDDAPSSRRHQGGHRGPPRHQCLQRGGPARLEAGGGGGQPARGALYCVCAAPDGPLVEEDVGLYWHGADHQRGLHGG